MAIEVKEVPVEAHNSVGLVERYHMPLRRAYDIIKNDTVGKGIKIDREAILQMAQKAVNDTAGPGGIVPTLLVFGAYPRIAHSDPPAPSVVQRAEAIRAATKELRKLRAQRQVTEGLAMRNGPDTQATLSLPINSEVRVWRENKGWKGPYRLIATDGETCTLNMPRGPTNFRSVSVKPFLRELDAIEDPVWQDADGPNTIEPDVIEDPTVIEDQDEAPAPPMKRGRGRPRKHPQLEANFLEDFDDQFMQAVIDETLVDMVFMTSKEIADMELSAKLRKDGRITTPGAPFEASQKQEIDGLLAREVFKFVQWDPNGEHSGIRVFKSSIQDLSTKSRAKLPIDHTRSPD